MSVTACAGRPIRGCWSTCVVAVVVAVLAVARRGIDVRRGSPGSARPTALAYALVIAGSLSLFWRRRAPIAVLAIVTAVLVAFCLREYGAFLSVLGLPALYAVAAHEEHRRRAWWAMAVACVALMVAASVSVLDKRRRLRLLHGAEHGAPS